jgi:hypothetical protein
MSSLPTRVFIVPYRNRPEQKFFFIKHMEFLMEHSSDYEIYFSHQVDERSFNRGAIKNIGFLTVKEKYPNDYKSMNFIFHDLDTLPFHRIFDYKTEEGVVKHYYGFDHSLGGIVVIKGSDFERINGFPNFWSWGLEDSFLQKRCARHQIQIDRSQFYKIGRPEILHLFDGVSRIINQKDPKQFNSDNGIIGLSTIHKLSYTVDSKSSNEKDNMYQAANERIFYINIVSFLSETRFEDDIYYHYDLREPVKNITNPDPRRRTNQVVATTRTWTEIPYVPTSQEKKDAQQNPVFVQRRPMQPRPQQPHSHPLPPPPPPQRPQQFQQVTPLQYRQMFGKNANVPMRR